MNNKTYNQELYSIYRGACNSRCWSDALVLLRELRSAGYFLSTNKPPKNPTSAPILHPTVFDEPVQEHKSVKVSEAIALMKDIAKEAPQQLVSNKEDLGNPFEEVIEAPTTNTKKYHKWDGADIRAILACMSNHVGHSHRSYEYVKGRVSPSVSDGAFKTKLARMGIAIKKGRVIWKNSKQN